MEGRVLPLTRPSSSRCLGLGTFRCLGVLLAGLMLGSLATELNAQQEGGLYEEGEKVFIEAEELVQAGETDAALNVYLTALDAETFRPQIEVFLRSCAARLLTPLGRQVEALDQLSLVEALIPESPAGDTQRADLYGHRAWLYLTWGLVDVALRWHERRMQLLNAMERRGEGVAWDRFNALVSGSRIYWSAGNIERMEELALEALALEVPTHHEAQEAELPGIRAQLLQLLGRVYIEIERNDPQAERRAARMLRQVVEGTAAQADSRAISSIMLADIALREGENEKAQVWLDAAWQVLEPMTQQERSFRRAEWAVVSARLALATGAGVEELSRWRDLLEEEHLRFVEYWSDTPIRPGGYGILYFDSNLHSELIRLILHLNPEHGPAIAFETLLEVQELSTLARRFSPGITSIQGLRQGLLEKDHALLVFLPGVERTYLFVLDQTRLGHFELESIHPIRQVANRLSSGLHRPCKDADERQTQDELRQRLSSMLFPAEVVGFLGDTHRLTLVGLDKLGAVPVECLPFRDEMFLGAGVAIDTLPSLPFGLYLARRARVTELRTADVWLMTAPTEDEGTPDQEPATGRVRLTPAFTAGLLAAYSPEQRRKVWAGPEASLRTLQDPALQGAGVIQFFTHGIFDPWREQPGGLLLSSNNENRGTLFSEDVESLRWPLLVMLTACRGAAAPTRIGDAGAADLGGAFLASGAQAVMDSAYDLEPEAARRMSSTIHRAVSRGETPAEALRMARSELAADPRFEDPFYHSLLRVVGLGHRPIFPPTLEETPLSTSLSWPVRLAAGTVITGLGLLAIRRRRVSAKHARTVPPSA